MRSLSPTFAIIITLALTTDAFSQPVPEPPPESPIPRPALPTLPPPDDIPVFQPAFAAARVPSLSDLVLAKVDLNDGAARVIMMIPAYRPERRNAKVTRFVEEKRERAVNVDGKQVTIPYTVMVPVTEEREVTTKVAAGLKPQTIDAKELRFYNLQAEEIPLDEVAKTLTFLMPVFLIEQADGSPLPLPDVARRALNETCVIVVTKKQIRQVPPPAAPAAFVPVVPADFAPPPIPAPDAIRRVVP